MRRQRRRGGRIAASRAAAAARGTTAIAAVAADESITREGTQCLLNIVRALSSAARPGHRVEFL